LASRRRPQRHGIPSGVVEVDATGKQVASYPKDAAGGILVTGGNLYLAGHILQKVDSVSGKKLGTYLSEHVFGPLGMNDTAFRITPAMRQRLARIHQRGEDGTLVPTDLEIPQDPEFEMGGGGLYGTVADLSLIQI